MGVRVRQSSGFRSDGSGEVYIGTDIADNRRGAKILRVCVPRDAADTAVLLAIAFASAWEPRFG